MTLVKQYLTILTIFLLPLAAMAQQPGLPIKCATEPVMKKWMQSPAAKQLQEQVEKSLLQYRLNNPNAQRPNAVVTLPIVVHIIHNNGPENISDAQAIQGVQFLNQAFANTGFYDPADGVDCQVQFCMARRDPAGNATNGITRNVSPLTNLNMDTDDIALKDLNRWNPLCYVNVWLVNEICSSGGCGVAGYAYYPSAHGLNIDGIVMEAKWFGSTPGNTGILVHEMGHYLGLKHTFTGGCTNNNCLVDGDAVCDTPPDQSTAAVACNGSVNSCTTDVLSGFSTDQNDLHRDYMDYGNQNCFSMFTQGQADRMNWHITNVRSSLLNCQSCLDPCPAPITANFTGPGATVNAGTSFTFINTSVNATGYEWYVNGVLQATTTNFTLNFSAVGTYVVKLVAKSASVLCSPSEKTVTIQAVCPVSAGFTKSAAVAPCGTNINFTNTSAGATSYEWYVNGTLQASTLNFNYTNAVAGKYTIKMIARNAALNCFKEVTDTVEYTCPVTVSITPQNPSVYINTAVNFTSTASGATTYQWLLNNVPAATTPNYGFTPAQAGNYLVTLIASNGICSASTSTFLIVKDSCLRTTFQKKFGGAGNDLLSDIRATADGGFISCGYSNGYGAGLYDGVIVKTDGLGNIQWNKVIGGAGNDYFNKVIPTSDGGYLAAGFTSSFGAANVEGWMVKLNSAGTVLWSRKYADGNPNGSVIWDVCQTSDGGYAFAGVNEYIPTLADAMIGKTDANGVVQWCKHYSGSSSDQSFGILEDNGVLIVSAFGAYLGGGTFYDGVFMKVDRANGNVLSATRYDIESRSNWFLNIYKQNNDYLIGCNNNNDFSNTAYAHIFLRLDNNGVVKQITRANSATDKSGADPFTPTADGGYLLAQCENNGAADMHLRKNTPAGNLQWLKKYGAAGSNDLLYSITQTPDNSFAGCGLSGTGGNNDFFMLKTDPLGESGGSCPSAATDGTNATPAYTASAFQWPEIAVVNISPNNTVNPSVTSAVFTPADICSGTTCVQSADTCFNAYQKTYGGTGDDIALCVKKVPGNNAGYIVSGYTSSYGAGGQDAYLLRLSAGGDVLWAKTYGGSGNDFFNHVASTASGGFVASGRTQSFGNSTGAAYVVNMDASGNVIWSKTLGNNTFYGEYGHSVKQTSDGGFVVCGSYNAGPSLSDLMVVRLDAGGNILWSKAFDIGTTDEGQDILEDNDTLVVVGYYRGGNFHDGILMKLNKTTGAVYWIKAYDVNGDNNGFYRIEKVPGGYSVLASSSNGFTNNGVKQVALRFDLNGNLIYSHQLTSATNKPTGDRIAYTADGGYVGTASEGISNDDVYFYKVNAQKQMVWKKRFNRSGNQNVYHIIDDGGSIVMTGLSSTAAGSPVDILFIKTTPTGNTPGCTTDSTDAAISNPFVVPVNYNPAVRNQSFSSANPPATVVTNTSPVVLTPCAFAGCDSIRLGGDVTVCLSADTITYRAIRTIDCKSPLQWIADPSIVKIISSNDTLMKVQFLKTGTAKIYVNLSTGCKVVSDSLVVTVQSCAVNTDSCGAYFSGNYFAAGDYVCSDFRVAKDRSIVSVGYRSNPVTGNDAMIVKTNSLGGVIWTRFIRGSGDDRFVKMRETKNGNFIAVGYTSSVGSSAKSILVSRFSANGNLLWSKVIGTNTATDDCTGAEVVETGNGQIVYCGKLNASPGNIMVVGKLTAGGNNVWIKHVVAFTAGFQVGPVAGVLNVDTLYITGVLNAGGIGTRGFIAKINTGGGNGNLINVYGIQNTSGQAITVTGIDKIPTGYSVSLLDNGRAGMLGLNPNLSVNTQGVHTSPWFLAGTNAYSAPTPDSGFITMGYRPDGNIALAKTAANGRIEWVRRTTGPIPIKLSRMESIPGGYLWVGSVISPVTGRFQAKIVRMGTDTHLGLCSADSIISSTLINTGFSTPLTGTWTMQLPTDSAYADWYLGVTGEPITDSLSCTKAVTCDSLKLSGPLVSCRLPDTLTYYAKRNPLCQLQVQWQFDTTLGQIISTTDSTIKIRWFQRGSTMLYATLQSACTLLKDSMPILLAGSPGLVNLGPDIQLCNASTITLRAGPGYKRYTWQDGNPDSVYTANLPGTYHVTVEDSCGNIYRDTVIISVAPAIPFSLGPPLLRCNNDTLTITAPAGFSSYTWAANYNISSQQGRIVKVWPAVDTVYSVVAVYGPGCQLFDTIRVKVSQSPPIRLGNDTSFCQGGSITLNAGPGFVTYVWSTGAATQTITVNTAGQYWVKGTAASGCVSADTLRILNIFANPVVNLGSDTSICQGNSLPLNAGAGFASYLWNTGAVTQGISVNTAGLYWVQVTNSNNCRARDSVQLLNVHPNPVVNIGNDTSFCQGGAALLNAGPGFSSYLWSSGSNTQSIAASTAGLYWVQVSNSFNCSSRDSMNVLAVFPKPSISLGRDTVLCAGSTVTLSPGAGFGSYLWQDNSTGSSFTTGTAGTYWVLVSNGNGCKAADTMKVLRISPIPKNFAPVNAAMCLYEPILVKGRGVYQTYLWSTGGTDNYTQVPVPGNYWLQVTNADGCTAKEDFAVADKNCLRVIFFPKAFTPTGDGLNDTYKPGVYAPLQSYTMAIYNRWGERVFFTTDPKKGWDGTYKGAAQDAGTFVWLSTYKFWDLPAVVDKGSFLLIR
jgi:gliding motility-associated-like protein